MIGQVFHCSSTADRIVGSDDLAAQRRNLLAEQRRVLPACHDDKRLQRERSPIGPEAELSSSRKTNKLLSHADQSASRCATFHSVIHCFNHFFYIRLPWLYECRWIRWRTTRQWQSTAHLRSLSRIRRCWQHYWRLLSHVLPVQQRERGLCW